MSDPIHTPPPDQAWGPQLVALVGRLERGLERDQRELRDAREEIGALRAELTASRGESATLRQELAALRAESVALRADLDAALYRGASGRPALYAEAERVGARLTALEALPARVTALEALPARVALTERLVHGAVALILIAVLGGLIGLVVLRAPASVGRGAVDREPSRAVAAGG